FRARAVARQSAAAAALDDAARQPADRARYGGLPVLLFSRQHHTDGSPACGRHPVFCFPYPCGHAGRARAPDANPSRADLAALQIADSRLMLALIAILFTVLLFIGVPVA